MKKKSTGPEELPLFDLPLRESPAEPRPRPSAAAKAGPAPEKARAPERRPAAAVSLDDQLHLSELDEIAAAEPGVAAKATIGDRFFAGLADLLLHGLVVGLASLAVLLIGHPVGWRELPPFVVFGLLFSFLYSVFSLAFWGQTPGMAWAGHLARSVTGEPLTFGQTMLRWLGGLLTLALAGLPLLLALAGGRSLSDRISDSKTLQL